jgi:4-amino-4-deoxy-L-arabinose transferase-like glycosyltransferase
MVQDVKTNSALPIQAVSRLIRGREEYVLGLLLLIVACIAAVVLHHADKYAFLYYGDAASHIVKARQFVDSQEAWLDIIGTVWLPLPHVLLLPFTAIDSLFFSGIAGPALGIPCLVGTGILLFLIVRRLTGSQPVAFLSACLFVLNPNVVYISLTPMNEACLFFFVALGGYGLLRWVYDGNALSLRSMAPCPVCFARCRDTRPLRLEAI